MSLGLDARRHLRAHRHGVLLRFDFDPPVTDATQARAALVAMAKQSRTA